MYKLEDELVVAADIDQVWDFFSNPENLQQITPPDMKMEVVDRLPDSMYEGMLVRYKVKALPGITLPWTSEITKIKEGHYFIDEQVEGPFKYWHHQHIFEPAESGTLIKDILHYRVPGGPIGKLFEPFLVRTKLNKVFSFRRKQSERLFGEYET